MKNIFRIINISWKHTNDFKKIYPKENLLFVFLDFIKINYWISEYFGDD